MGFKGGVPMHSILRAAIGLAFSQTIFAASALASQPGYKVCADMSAEAKRECIQVVKRATRRYPEQVVSYIQRLGDPKQENEILGQTLDYVYPGGSLDICDGAKDAKELTQCLKDLGTKEPNYKSVGKRLRAVSEIRIDMKTAVRDVANRTGECKDGKVEWIYQYSGDSFLCVKDRCSNAPTCWQCRGEYMCYAKDFWEVQ